MPVIIDSWEADGDGGYFIEWNDPSQDFEGFIEVTPELMDEFIVHFRRHRKAPTDRLDAARDGMGNPQLPDAATVQLFRLAYEELIGDIIDLKERGLRPDTPYTVHEQVRAGGKPDDEWLIDKRPDEFKQFIETRSSE